MLPVCSQMRSFRITGRGRRVQGGSPMLRYRAVFLLVIFLFVAHVSAQTPRAATDHFKNGNKKLESGDLTGAIEELSWAIEISSRLDVNRGTTHKALANGFADIAGDASDITVIDPFTAHAYTSRGLARYRLGDVDGAIMDWIGRSPSTLVSLRLTWIVAVRAT